MKQSQPENCQKDAVSTNANSVFVKNPFKENHEDSISNFDDFAKKKINKSRRNKNAILHQKDTNTMSEVKQKIQPLKNVVKNETHIIDCKLPEEGWQEDSQCSCDENSYPMSEQLQQGEKGEQILQEYVSNKKLTEPNKPPKGKQFNLMKMADFEDDSDSEEVEGNFLSEENVSDKKLADLEKTSNENNKKEVVNQIPGKRTQKRPNILINFEDGDTDSEEEGDIQNQQKEENNDNLSRKSSQKSINSIQFQEKKPEKNVFLCDFGSDSSLSEYRSNHDLGSHSQSSTKIALQSRIRQDKPTNGHNGHQKNNLHRNNSIEIIKPLTAVEFLKQNKQSYAHSLIPEGFMLQTSIRRVTNSNKEVEYFMTDTITKQDIMKASVGSDGYWIQFCQGFLNTVLGDDEQEDESMNQRYISMNTHRNKGGCKSSYKALLVSNFFGTEFNCFLVPSAHNKLDSQDKLSRILTVRYDMNVFGLKGPRKMAVYIPKQDHLIRGQKNLEDLYEQEDCNSNGCSQNKSGKKVMRFVNKSPRWNNQISAHVLNFNGRATVSSVKNFIITKESEDIYESQISYILFGKVQKDKFNLDIKHPFSMMQAIALALSSFDRKLACE